MRKSCKLICFNFLRVLSDNRNLTFACLQLEHTGIGKHLNTQTVFLVRFSVCLTIQSMFYHIESGLKKSDFISQSSCPLFVLATQRVYQQNFNNISITLVMFIIDTFFKSKEQSPIFIFKFALSIHTNCVCNSV